MALEFEKLSTHLKEVLLNLKHMSPMQRFNEVTKPRFELQWQTVAFRYGCERLERQGWLIPDQEILSQTPKTLPLINADHADQEQKQNPPRRHWDTEEIGGSEKQNSNTLSLMNADHADQQQGTDLPQRAQRTRRKSQEKTLLLMNADETDSRQVSGVAASDPELDDGLAPKSTQQAAIPREIEDHMRSGQEKVLGVATLEPIPQEQLNRLYTGDDRRYIERPEVEQERQHSIEMAARIAAAESTQLNGRWQVLRDEEVLQPAIRAEIDERGGVESIPVNEDLVLARAGG